MEHPSDCAGRVCRRAMISPKYLRWLTNQRPELNIAAFGDSSGDVPGVSLRRISIGPYVDGCKEWPINRDHSVGRERVRGPGGLGDLEIVLFFTPDPFPTRASPAEVVLKILRTFDRKLPDAAALRINAAITSLRFVRSPFDSAIETSSSSRSLIGKGNASPTLHSGLSRSSVSAFILTISSTVALLIPRTGARLHY